MPVRIGVLTAGSDSPGLNAAIRAIGKAGRDAYNMQVIGFQDGFQGLAEDRQVKLEGAAFSGILTLGGTILGTSRFRPEAMLKDGVLVDRTAEMIATYRENKLDGLICIGGRETQSGGLHLAQAGLNVITLPKAIDNHVAITETTIGFDTALTTAAEAIDRLHSTALATHRIIIVEILGNNAGWLTLGAGIAGGADVILIPEIPYQMERVAEAIQERSDSGKKFSIIAVSEGAMSVESASFFERSRQVNETMRSGDEKALVAAELERIESSFTGNTILLASQLEKMTGLETRITILGYLLRGGTPSALDRVLATQLGTEAIRMISQGKFGIMLAMRQNHIEPVALEEVAGRIKAIPSGHPWLDSARLIGTRLGTPG
jgi:ATP-dependent phosphofructokinase / diphosphate-dependent phosphofructokinase